MPRRLITTSGPPGGDGMTTAARFADAVFLSTLTGLGQGGSSAEDQATGLFESARLALEALDATTADVVQARFYVCDWRHLPPLNAAYASVFEEPYTARTTVRSPSLREAGVLLEASFVAVCGGERRVLGHPDLFTLPVPLAQAGVLAGGRFFGTGLVGVDRELRAGASIEAQTAQALANQALALEAAGLTPDDVVKVNLFVRDGRLLEGMLAVYQRFFRPPYPALWVAITTLARPEWLMEIEVIASPGEKIALLAPGAPAAQRLGWSTRQLDLPPPLNGPESAAVLCGGWLYSGSLASRAHAPRTTDCETEVAAQLQRLGLILQAADCTLDDVLLIGAALVDWRHSGAFSSALEAALPQPGPARALVEQGLADSGLTVQMEVVAAQGGSTPQHNQRVQP